MTSNEFSIINFNKKSGIFKLKSKDLGMINADNIKGGIRQGDISEKYKNIFGMINTTKQTAGEEILDAAEIKAFLTYLIVESGDDFEIANGDIKNIVGKYYAQVKDAGFNLTVEDLYGFVCELCEQSGYIVESKTETNENGEKVVITKLIDGTKETVNPDGTSTQEYNRGNYTVTNSIDENGNTTKTEITGNNRKEVISYNDDGTINESNVTIEEKNYRTTRIEEETPKETKGESKKSKQTEAPMPQYVSKDVTLDNVTTESNIKFENNEEKSSVVKVYDTSIEGQKTLIETSKYDYVKRTVKLNENGQYQIVEANAAETEDTKEISVPRINVKQMINKDGQVNLQANYSYDENGNTTTKLFDPKTPQESVEITEDKKGRMTKQIFQNQEGQQVIATNEYDDENKITKSSITYPDGAKEEAVLDMIEGGSRVKTTTETDKNGKITHKEYSFDDDKKQFSITETITEKGKKQNAVTNTYQTDEQGNSKLISTKTTDEKGQNIESTYGTTKSGLPTVTTTTTDRNNKFVSKTRVTYTKDGKTAYKIESLNARGQVIKTQQYINGGVLIYSDNKNVTKYDTYKGKINPNKYYTGYLNKNGQFVSTATITVIGSGKTQYLEKTETLKNGVTKKSIPTGVKDNGDITWARISETAYNSWAKKNVTVQYDGKGNTAIVVQHDEDFQKLKERFGNNRSDFKQKLIQLNPKLDVNNILPGSVILVPGEYSYNELLEKKDNTLNRSRIMTSDEVIYHVQANAVGGINFKNKCKEKIIVNVDGEKYQILAHTVSRDDLKNYLLRNFKFDKYLKTDTFYIAEKVGASAYDKDKFVVLYDLNKSYNGDSIADNDSTVSNPSNSDKLFRKVDDDVVANDVYLYNIFNERKNLVQIGDEHYVATGKINELDEKQLISRVGELGMKSREVDKVNYERTDDFFIPESSTYFNACVEIKNNGYKNFNTSLTDKNTVWWKNPANGEVIYANQGNGRISPAGTSTYYKIANNEANEITKDINSPSTTYKEQMQKIYSSDIAQIVSKHLYAHRIELATKYTNGKDCIPYTDPAINEATPENIITVLGFAKGLSVEESTTLLNELVSKKVLTPKQQGSSTAFLLNKEVTSFGGASHNNVVNILDIIKDPTSRQSMEIAMQKYKNSTSWHGSYVAGTTLNALGDQSGKIALSTWGKNNVFDPENPNDHKIITDLINQAFVKKENVGDEDRFEEVVSAALTVAGANGKNFDIFVQKCEQVNKQRGYQAFIQEQGSDQIYLANISDDGKTVNIERLEYWNNKLYLAGEDGIPAKVLSEVAAMACNQGNYEKAFESIDPKFQSAMEKQLADGQIKGCETWAGLYNQAKQNIENRGYAVYDGLLDLNTKVILSGKAGEAGLSDADIEQTFKKLLKKRSEEAQRLVELTGSPAGGQQNVIENIVSDIKQMLALYPELKNVGNSMTADDFKMGTPGKDALGQTNARFEAHRKFMKECTGLCIEADSSKYFDDQGNEITDENEIKNLKEKYQKQYDNIEKTINALTMEFEAFEYDGGALASIADGFIEGGKLSVSREDMKQICKDFQVELRNLRLAKEGKLTIDGKHVSFESYLKDHIFAKLSKAQEDFNKHQGAIAMGEGLVKLAPIIIISIAASYGTGTLATLKAFAWIKPFIPLVAGISAGSTSYLLDRFGKKWTCSNEDQAEKDATSIALNTTAGAAIGSFTMSPSFTNMVSSYLKSNAAVKACQWAVNVGGDMASMQMIDTPIYGQIAPETRTMALVMSLAGNGMGALSNLNKGSFAKRLRDLDLNNTNAVNRFADELKEAIGKGKITTQEIEGIYNILSSNYGNRKYSAISDAVKQNHQTISNIVNPTRPVNLANLDLRAGLASVRSQLDKQGITTQCVSDANGNGYISFKHQDKDYYYVFENNKLKVKTTSDGNGSAIYVDANGKPVNIHENLTSSRKEVIRNQDAQIARETVDLGDMDVTTSIIDNDGAKVQPQNRNFFNQQTPTTPPTTPQTTSRIVPDGYQGKTVTVSYTSNGGKSYKIEIPASVKPEMHKLYCELDFACRNLFPNNAEAHKQALKLFANAPGAKAKKGITQLLKCYDFSKAGDLATNIVKHSDMPKLAQAGFFDLVCDGKIDINVLNKLNENSHIAPQVFDDLALIKQGKDTVKDGFANVDDAFNGTKVGDVVEVDGKMYINDGENLAQWNMTREKYNELFPPVERFMTKQGRDISNCYLIQAMNDAMLTPKARVIFLQSFQMDGKDLVVTVKGLEDFNGSFRYPNGEFSAGKHVIGCKGMQIYEDLYSRVALRDNLEAPAPTAINVAGRSNWGLAYQTYADVFGLGVFNDIAHSNIPRSHAGLSRTTKNIDSYIDTYLQLYPNHALSLTKLDSNAVELVFKKLANRDDVVLSFGTKKTDLPEGMIDPKYNIVGSHAYTIVGYDAMTKHVIISNPHACGTHTRIPLDKFIEYYDHIDMAYLNGKPNNTTRPVGKNWHTTNNGYERIVDGKTTHKIIDDGNNRIVYTIENETVVGILASSPSNAVKIGSSLEELNKFHAGTTQTNGNGATNAANNTDNVTTNVKSNGADAAPKAANQNSGYPGQKPRLQHAANDPALNLTKAERKLEAAFIKKCSPNMDPQEVLNRVKNVLRGDSTDGKITYKVKNSDGTITEKSINLSEIPGLDLVWGRYWATKATEGKLTFGNTEVFGSTNRSAAIDKIMNSDALEKYLKNLDFTADKGKVERLLREYFDKNLEVYSMNDVMTSLEKIKAELSNLYGDNVIFYIPQKTKSYDIIEQLYRQIDPNARFVYEPGNIKTIPEGSNVVILDDCIGSGGSVIKTAKKLKEANRGFNINSASIFSTTEGQARINAEGIRTISANSKTRLTDSPFFKGLEPEDQTLLLLTLDGNKILMPDYHGSDRLAILFPWMSPNNNSLCFAAVTSEIALCPNQAIKNLPWVMDPTPSQSMGGLIGLHDLSTMLNKKVNFETLTQLNTICDGKLFNEKFTVHYFMSLENPTLKYILPGLDLDKLRGLITEEGANEFWDKLLIPNK